MVVKIGRVVVLMAATILPATTFSSQACPRWLYAKRSASLKRNVEASSMQAMAAAKSGLGQEASRPVRQQQGRPVSPTLRLVLQLPQLLRSLGAVILREWMVVKAVLAVVHTAVTTRTGISSCTTLSHLFGTVKRNASAKPAALALSMEAAVVAVKCGLAQKALKLQYHSKVPYVLFTVA